MSSKMKRRVFLFIALIVVIAGGSGVYLYMKPNRNLAKVKADFEVGAAELLREFSQNESAAGEKYVGKVIQVTGPLAGIETSNKGKTILFLLDDFRGISCSMDSLNITLVTEELESLGPGDTITVRGRCNGILMDVQLSGCVLVKE